MDVPRLILASASPRRQELLREAGYAFTVVPADIDEEDVAPNLSAGDLAESLARRKAAAIAARSPDAVILAADTVVSFAERILNKPRDADDAARMLRLLSGTVHSVITGVAVMRASANVSLHARVLSAVHMRPLTDAEMAAYVASRQWEGKAGGYGIQDPDPFVTRTAGCHTNIVGLPMHTAADLLREAGVAPAGASIEPR